VRKAEQLMQIALHQTAMTELDAAREKAPNSPIAERTELVVDPDAIAEVDGRIAAAART